MSFNKGDIVQLKSGGPKMTVKWCEDQHGEMTALCQWFDGAKRSEETFAPETLKKVEDKEPPMKLSDVQKAKQG